MSDLGITELIVVKPGGVTIPWRMPVNALPAL